MLKRLSQAQKDSYQRNPGRAINNSRIMKELWQDPEYRRKVREGQNTPEAKLKHSVGTSHATKRMWQNPEIRTKIIESRKQTYQDPQYKARASKRFKELWQNPEFKARMAEIRKRLWQEPEFRKMMIEAQSESALRKWQNPEYRQRQVEAQMRSWQAPEIIAKRFAGLNKKPTKPEQRLMDIFSKHLPQFQYNGDFRLGVMLGGLFPDFVNVNGRKEVIEFFGDYHHSPEVIGDDWRRSELGKLMIYNSLGWNCLVIWQSELDQLSDTQVVQRVTKFFKQRR